MLVGATAKPPSHRPSHFLRLFHSSFLNKYLQTLSKGVDFAYQSLKRMGQSQTINRQIERREHTAGKARRITHRSRTGTKLYAVRDSKGRFKDIQTYKRAHGMDIKRKSKKEK
jgi:hypothetical protein